MNSIGLLNSAVDPWKLVAGLGIFLFGMRQIEEALKTLGGLPLKLFLKKYTKNAFQAVCVGIVATVIVQSSSIVSLITMAFVGAGIINLRNALGIIFGCNLGTTFTGWIVTALGFKFNLEGAFLPCIGIGALGLIFSRQQNRLWSWSSALLGFGFLLMGLSFLKASAEALVPQIDMAWLAGYPLIVFFMAGAALTAMIHSSSAMVMITLTALNAGLIDYLSACAIVIGADLGTTLTAVIGAIKGTADKKRVALAHFLFNVVTAGLALIAIVPLTYSVQKILGVTDPLYGLVAFHSLFNLIGVLIFLPFLSVFADFLSRRFIEPQEISAKYIARVTVEIPEAAVAALRDQVQDLIQKVVHLSSRMGGLDGMEKSHRDQPAQVLSYYEKIKEIEGEIIRYVIQLQQSALTPDIAQTLAHLLVATQQAVLAAKCIKDVGHNLVSFHQALEGWILTYDEALRHFLASYYKESLHFLARKTAVTDVSLFQALLSRAQTFHDEQVNALYALLKQRSLPDIELATFLNVNREMLSANQALVAALQAYNAN